MQRDPGDHRRDDGFAAADAAYDELLEREDVEFHLAYVANLEATITPLFKMVFDNRRELFEGSDEPDEPLPAWVDTWHAAYDRGADVTTYEGVGL